MAKKAAKKTTKKPKTSRDSLVISLDFDKSAYTAAQKQKMVFSLTNTSDKAVRVLKWHTPLEGIKSDMFEVQVNGNFAVSMGRVYKRPAPVEDDYITIGPGKTISEDVDFTEAYDIAEAGIYSVKYRTDLLHVGFGAPKAMAKQFASPQRTAAVSVKSGTGIFKLLEDREPKQVDGIEIGHAREMLAQIAAPKAPTFSSCAQAQQGPITSALAQAVTMVSSARAALSGTPNWARYTAKRYSEWFGVYDAGRYATVSTHYDKILDALSNQAMKFNCDCNDNYYAYVIPTKPYEVFLCKLFWTAPLTGTDSKAGTIIHETSHFNVVAGTQDHVYGQAGCRALAKSNPGNAIGNADTHEYFAENTPPLTMDALPGSIIKVTDFWRNMPAGFGGGFDAALNGGGPFAGKCYFFKGDKYIRYDWASDKADPGYPVKISDAWHNLPAGFTSNFDAAVNGQGAFSGKCYFFKGDSYIRYDWGADKADAGYPKKIADNWNNLPAGFKNNFDAAMNGAGPFAGKLYIFKGNNYIRYDWQTDKTDPGYPANIAANWHALPAGYTGSFDTAVEGAKQFSDRGYFFKGNNYIRYSWSQDRAEQ
jgi:peptidyl-Lys metalloendopeptidase